MTERPHHTDATLLAQSLGKIDATTNGIVAGIHPAVTYQRTVTPDGYLPGTLYARDENPGFHQAEAMLAQLERAADGIVVSSGMAAYSLLLLMMPPGSHVIAPRTAFVTFGRWLRELAPRWGYTAAFYDNDNLEQLEAALKAQKTYAVWIETPGNPLWPLTAIAAAAALCRQYEAKLIVDNTVPSPLLTKPLTLGADYVMHSCTKYLNGHHDVVMGAVLTAQKSDEWTLVRRLRKDIGAVPSPFDVWLLVRGMQTLHLRVKAASSNALALAQFLEAHPKVERVLYPGLTSHPQHDLAQRQMHGGFGGMLSFCVKGGREAALKVCQRVTLFKVATSIGGTLSLIEHRRSIEPDTDSIPQNLLRVSVGIEDAADLQADLHAALSGL
ncbi:MAG: PLP-dependent transferase [Thalassospira sp.]|nr:PLP-dependent transferase [Thalassospira sp.]